MKAIHAILLSWLLFGAAVLDAKRAKYSTGQQLKAIQARMVSLQFSVDSLARQADANERAFLRILDRIETKGWTLVRVDGLLSAYDYERQCIMNQPENQAN